MEWEKEIHDFETYLLLEKGLSRNTIEAYYRDIGKLADFCRQHESPVSPETVTPELLSEFLQSVSGENLCARSQARLLSCIKTFYKFMIIEENLETNPAQLLETPKIGTHLPDVLSVEEIVAIINAASQHPKDGQRNRAIIETLYSSGVRVSELINMKINDLNLQDNYIKVHGKGNKERLVLLGRNAHEALQTYIEGDRTRVPKIKEYKNFIFLCRSGKPLSRVRVYNIIQELIDQIGLPKRVSPHTFRHSFATHLVNGGADIRLVQDMLGHESITTTEIYTHIDNEYLRDTLVNCHPRGKK